jgi:hypothetical protein
MVVKAVHDVNPGEGYQHPDVRQLIVNYIEARDIFNREGGEEFTRARNDLRSEYVNTDISKERLDAEISAIPNNTVRELMRGRIDEWNIKLKAGMLEKPGELSLTHDAFVVKLRAFVEHYAPMMETDSFTRQNTARTALSDAVRREFIIRTPDDLIRQYAIEDEELCNRIKVEWFGKYIAKDA